MIAPARGLCQLRSSEAAARSSFFSLFFLGCCCVVASSSSCGVGVGEESNPFSSFGSEEDLSGSNCPAISSTSVNQHPKEVTGISFIQTRVAKKQANFMMAGQLAPAAPMDNIPGLPVVGGSGAVAAARAAMLISASSEEKRVIDVEGVLSNDTTTIASAGNNTNGRMKKNLEMVQEHIVGCFTEWDHIVKGDVFGNGKDQERNLGLSFFYTQDLQGWCVFAASVFAMLLVDTCVLRRNVTEVRTLTCAAWTVAFWLLVGVAFNAWIYWQYGSKDAYQWLSGYILEWLLSFDNLFVFHLVFSVYKTPEKLLPKALFWGIIGAILFRMAFFMALSSLFHWLHWVRYIFGALLIWSGISAAIDQDEPEDPSETWVVKFLLKFLPIVPWYDPNGRLWVRVKEGEEERPPLQEERGENLRAMDGGGSETRKFRFTLLFVVICCLEATDVMFAADSVSAKVAQIPNQYLAYTSSVFAMFALRALFFIIEYLVRYLSLLKYGLCLILVFIGVELVFSDYVQLPASTVCIMLVSVFSLSVAVSVIQSAFEDHQKKLDAASGSREASKVVEAILEPQAGG